MRKYIQRSILKGETRPSHKVVAPTLVCATPIQMVANNAIIPTFNFNNAPPAFTLILEEDSFGFIQSHSIAINNANVAHIKLKIESVTKLNNGQPEPIFSVDTVSAFITISAPNASFLRVLPYDGGDYEESAHVHLGLIPDPDPRGTSYVSDFNLRSATSLDNKTSVLTSYIAPYEDRTSESVNRAIDSVANNAENNYLAINNQHFEVVHVKVNDNIGNDEFMANIQQDNFSMAAIVPILQKYGNSWVRSIKPSAILQNFNNYTNNESKLNIVGFITNQPLYIYDTYPYNEGIHNTFINAYKYSRTLVSAAIADNIDNSSGFNPCSVSTKLFVNNSIFLGNESSFEAFERLGNVDNVFGSIDYANIIKHSSFWIVGGGVSQQVLDTVSENFLECVIGNQAFTTQNEFKQGREYGWVAYPGTLYGTKAFSGIFECLDRGTIRYISTNDETLPSFISEGMLLTNSKDAYEIVSVVDQKTILVKPVLDYSDILIGDVSRLQRVELIPGLSETFEFYFGKYLTKRQVGIFSVKPISVESIVKSQRGTEQTSVDDLLISEKLDLGVLVRLHNTNVPDNRNLNKDDLFLQQNGIGSIDNRLALLLKFIRTTIGPNLNAVNASPISLESTVSDSFSTRSPFKVSENYITQPITENDYIASQNKTLTVPSVLSYNFLKKNSSHSSYTDTKMLPNLEIGDEAVYNIFEQTIVNNAENYTIRCFTKYQNIYSVSRWKSLLRSIETNSFGAQQVSDLREICANALLLPDVINFEETWVKQLNNIIYSLLAYYGYFSVLHTSHDGTNPFKLSLINNKVGLNLINSTRQLYIDHMNTVSNATYLGNGLVKIKTTEPVIGKESASFSLRDVGKVFYIAYVCADNQTSMSYTRQVRAYMDEWYNGSCAKFSIDGINHRDIESMIKYGCFISYGAGQSKPQSEISETLNEQTRKSTVMVSASREDLIGIPVLSTKSRFCEGYNFDTSYSSIFVSNTETFLYLPLINAFAYNCEILSHLPIFDGCYINLELASMTYDLMTKGNVGNNTTEPFTEFVDMLKVFFNIDQSSNEFCRIIPKQHIGVNRVMLEIQIALPGTISIRKRVECTKTHIASDGTIFFVIDTSLLFTETQRQHFVSKHTSVQLTQKLNNVDFNGLSKSGLSVNAGPQKYYINTSPILRNLLSSNNGYASLIWFSSRGISIYDHRVIVNTTILSINAKENAYNVDNVVSRDVFIEKVPTTTFKLSINPDQNTNTNAVSNNQVTIENYNDSTALSILQKNSITQSRNIELFTDLHNTRGDINSGISVETEPRIDSDQAAIDITKINGNLYTTETSQLSQTIVRQVGVASTSIAVGESPTPAILGLTAQDTVDLNAINAKNFAIGTISGFSTLDNQVRAQNILRPESASLQTNHNVLLDNTIIYVGSDNVPSGNARTNWKGTGFKSLGGFATSINTITSARQPDENIPTLSSNSNNLVSFYPKSGEKTFRYVDIHGSSSSTKRGRGYSSKNANTTLDTPTFKKIGNTAAVQYEQLPNYLGENDVIYSFTVSDFEYVGNYTFFPNNVVRLGGVFNSMLSGPNPQVRLNRKADTGRCVSVRILFSKDLGTLDFSNLEGTGFATGYLPFASNTNDSDWGPQVAINGLLLDSFITQEMLNTCMSNFGIPLDQAYELLVNFAKGNSAENWLKGGGTKIQVLVHGREWNANIHSLSVGGQITLGNNFEEKTLAIILDKERKSALIDVPNGSLHIDTADNLHIDASSVSGSGINRIQEAVAETHAVDLPINRKLTIMSLPIRPAIANMDGESITPVGMTQDEVRSKTNILLTLSSYIVNNDISDLLVPPRNGYLTSDIATNQYESIKQSRSDTLDLFNCYQGAVIYDPALPVETPQGTATPDSSWVNELGEVGISAARNDLSMDAISPNSSNKIENVSKKYFILDLGDYLASDLDESIKYIKTYITYDIQSNSIAASNGKLSSSDISAAIRNDSLNSFQLGDRSTGSALGVDIDYERFLDKEPNQLPQGIIRAFTTADKQSNNQAPALDYEYNKPLNISKLEATLLGSDPDFMMDLVNQDGLAQNESYKRNKSYMDIKHVSEVIANNAPPRTIVARYNAKAYIRPVLIADIWSYVLELPGPNIVFTLKLETYIDLQKFVYPVVDYNIGFVNDRLVYEQSTSSTTLNSIFGGIYNRDALNNAVGTNQVDMYGRKAFFTRPCITWVNYSIEFKSGTADVFGLPTRATIQPSHYMPTWLHRGSINENTRPRYADSSQFAAQRVFLGVYKFMRSCTEIDIMSNQGDLRAVNKVSMGDAIIRCASYSNSQNASATLDAYTSEAKIWQNYQAHIAKIKTNLDWVTKIPTVYVSPEKYMQSAQVYSMSKKYRVMEDKTFKILTLFKRTNRAYYSLFDVLDYAEDGDSLVVAGNNYFTDDIALNGPNAWTEIQYDPYVQHKITTLKNLGLVIRAYVSISVDAHRMYRIVNSTTNTGAIYRAHLYIDETVRAEADLNDPRKCSSILEATVPYLLKFTRK